MCYKVRCSACGKSTWAGCGRHVRLVYQQINEAQRCFCKEWPGISTSTANTNTDGSNASNGVSANPSASLSSSASFSHCGLRRAVSFSQIWLMEHIEQLESELEDQICNINMALAECSSNKRLSRGEVEPDFISAVPNDVLLQIFVRLPDVQSVVRCSAVCKRWSSLISNLSNSFIRGFIQYHKGEMSSSDSLPYTMLLFLFDGKLFYQLFSKGSKSLHRRAYKWSDSFRYLDFLPWPRVHVQASFDDLLLLTPPIYNPRPLQYCICNSLTRRWLILPLEAPPVQHHPNTRHGLACKSKNCSNDNEDVNNDDNNIRYKVVRLDTDTNSISSVDNGYVLRFTIFCSESGRWSQSTLFAPSALAPRFTHLSEPIGTSNGILHFPVISGPQGRRGGSFTGSILAFDPFGDSSTPDPKQSKFIDKPTGFSPTAKSCLGVVKGQLRLWQSGIFDAGNFFFKIWELNYEHQISDGPSTTSWLLLYDGKVKKQIAWRMSMAGFDPDNGNVVFIMTYSGGIYKYKIEEEEYEQVGEIPSDILSKGLKEQYNNFLRSVTLVHPIWPTAIPSLPIP